MAGQPYFVLKAGNGEIIGTSEMSSTASSMERGIASVRMNARFTPVDDQTASRVGAGA